MLLIPVFCSDDTCTPGQAKASVRATARLAGVSAVAILKTLDSVNLEPSKLAQMLMESGFDAVNLTEWRTAGIPDIAMPAAGGYANAIILEYYAYEAGRYCTLQARLVCRSFNTIGIRAWIQDKLGWTKPVTDNKTGMTEIQLLAAIAKNLAELAYRIRELDPEVDLLILLSRDQTIVEITIVTTLEKVVIKDFLHFPS
jgi:hypothetical protein